MEKIGGSITFKIDGQKYTTSGNFEVSLARSTKAVMVDQEGNAVGYTEADFRAPKLSGEIIVPPGTPLQTFIDMTGVSAELVLGNRRFIGTDGVNVAENTFNTEEGKMEIEIHFTDLQEV